MSLPQTHEYIFLSSLVSAICIVATRQVEKQIFYAITHRLRLSRFSRVLGGFIKIWVK